MNNFDFELIEIEKGSKAAVYTVLKYGQYKNELRRFQQKERVKECQEELERLDFLIFHTIPFEYGFHREYFYPERSDKTGKVKLPKGKLSVDMGRLRLFCIRLSQKTAIFGNGGYKLHDKTGQRTGTADFGHLDQYMNDALEVYRRVNKRIQNQSIIVNPDSGELMGNLIFKKY